MVYSRKFIVEKHENIFKLRWCGHFVIFTLRLQWSVGKLCQIFSNERHWSRDGKINIDFFFRLLRVFHRSSINIGIEVHCFTFALGIERTEALLKDLHATSILSFPNANEKSVLQSLIMASCIRLISAGFFEIVNKMSIKQRYVNLSCFEWNI